MKTIEQVKSEINRNCDCADRMVLAALIYEDSIMGGFDYRMALFTTIYEAKEWLKMIYPKATSSRKQCYINNEAWFNE